MLNVLNTLALLLGYGVIIISILLLIVAIILISIPTIENGVMSKFAWLPTKVETWRDPSTKAIVWLQVYFIKIDKGIYTPLDGDTPIGTKYVDRLGCFSYEF